MTLIGRPPEISALAARIDASVDVALLIVSATFVAALVWMIVAILRGRRRHVAPGDPGSVSWRIALLALAFFVVADLPLALMFAPDLRALWDVAAQERDPRALRVRILARQWGWDARLAGQDSAFDTPDDVRLVNELRAPTGRPVILELESVDVVHSLHVPSLRLQQDIIPGHVGKTWFLADTSGAFEATCSQFCGASHFQMTAPFIAMEPAEFDAWVAEASARATREASARAAREASARAASQRP